MLAQRLCAALLLTSMVSAGDFSGRYALPIPVDSNGNEIAQIEVRQDTASDPGVGVAPTDGPGVSDPPAPAPTESDPPPPPPQTTDNGDDDDDDDDDDNQTSVEPQPTTPPPPSTPPPQTSASPTPQPSSSVDDDDDDEETSTTLKTSTTPKPSSSTSKAQPTTEYSASETTIVVTRTLDNGQLSTGTSVQTSMIPTNTVEPISSEPDTSGGMSSKTKATVIGVVCGVGGAILLAVGFFFFWKWHSRRKQRAAIDDGDELVGMNAMGGIGEKGHGAAGADGQDKFKSTLESYHAPSGRANPSANF